MIAQLPFDCLLLIFEYLQPNYQQITSSRWARPHEEIEEYLIKDKLIVKEGDERWKNRYHFTTQISQRKPILLILSQVCQTFRIAARTHPFFATLQLHKLLKIPRGTEENLGNVLKLSQGVNNLLPHLTVRNIERIVLEPAAGNQLIMAQDLLKLFSFINDDLKVLELILHLGWSALGSSEVLARICQFQNLQRLFLRGKRESDILHGFSSAAIRQLSRNFSNLTHLYVESFGGGSFTWKSFNMLLKNNPRMETLSIGLVGQINLNDIRNSCPKLKTLIIQLETTMVVNRHTLAQEADPDLGPMHNLYAITPDIIGSLAKFDCLERITVHGKEHPMTNITAVFQRLLRGIPKSKLNQRPEDCQLGQAIELKS